jgi:MerR family transcriptional regulator, light-induced transcriptional regulator
MSDPGRNSGLSIGRLAEETGVAAGTLRMWETRHGFPEPAHRHGRRRYGADDVERVKQVQAGRERGLSLAAAIERARGWTPTVSRSLFAALQAHQPQVAATRLSLGSMRSLSHAIEDECLARADRPIVAAGFQTAAAFRTAAPRWRELARTSRLAFVLADFKRMRAPKRGPREIPVKRSAPIRREWAVICLDQHFTACLAGWEVPGDRARRFEAAWTTDPAAVVGIMRTAVVLAGPALEDEGREALTAFAEAPATSAEMTVRLSNRMIGYLAS